GFGGQGPGRFREEQRQAGHQGGLAAQQPVEPRRREGPGHHALARRVAVETAGHHASPHRAIRTYAQRSSDQVRPRPGCRARPEGGGVSHRPRNSLNDRATPNLAFIQFWSSEKWHLAKLKSLTPSLA